MMIAIRRSPLFFTFLFTEKAASFCAERMCTLHHGFSTLIPTLGLPGFSQPFREAAGDPLHR